MMNFYQMDVDSIERHYRNTDQSIPDVVQALIDQLKEANIKLDALESTLDHYDYSTCNSILEMELQAKEDEYDALLEEYKELQHKMESLEK